MTRCSALLLSALLAFAACSRETEKKASPDLTAPADTAQRAAPADTTGAILSELKQNTVENGKAVYEANCIRCHGPGGHSVMEGVPHLAEGGCPKRELRGIITSGVGLMPSFKGQLTEQEIGQVVNYVVHLREQNQAAH